MELPGENAIVLSSEFTFLKPSYPGDVLSYNAQVIDVKKRFAFVEIEVNVLNQNQRR